MTSLVPSFIKRNVKSSPTPTPLPFSLSNVSTRKGNISLPSLHTHSPRHPPPTPATTMTRQNTYTLSFGLGIKTVTKNDITPVRVGLFIGLYSGSDLCVKTSIPCLVLTIGPQIPGHVVTSRYES